MLDLFHHTENHNVINRMIILFFMQLHNIYAFATKTSTNQKNMLYARSMRAKGMFLFKFLTNRLDPTQMRMITTLFTEHHYL